MRFWNHTWEREHPTLVNKQEAKLISKTGSETRRQWSWMVGKSRATVWTSENGTEYGAINIIVFIWLLRWIATAVDALSRQ